MTTSSISTQNFFDTRHDRAVESDAVDRADHAMTVAAGADARRLDRPSLGRIERNFECGAFVAVEQRGGESRVCHFVILPSCRFRATVRAVVYPTLQELPMRMRALLLFVIVLSAFPLLAVDIHDTRLLSDPAVSGDRIAFGYANDLWVANLDGTRRAAADVASRHRVGSALLAGREVDRLHRPLRRQHRRLRRAVRGRRAEAADVASEGRRRARLHAGWRERPLHLAARGLHRTATPALHGAGRRRDGHEASDSARGEGGRTRPTERRSSTSRSATRSTNGSTTAAAQVSNLVIFDTATYATEHVPQPAGRCNDTDPMWLDGKVYFRSDRDGEFNIYSYDPATKKIAKLTNHSDFPVVNATAGGGKIIYEQAGYLHLLDPKTRQRQPR